MFVVTVMCASPVWAQDSTDNLLQQDPGGALASEKNEDVRGLLEAGLAAIEKPSSSWSAFNSLSC